MGDQKKLSIEHEEHIATMYHGRRSKSSGASHTDKGDVRAGNTIFECKCKGGPGVIRSSMIIKQLEKVADEAWAEGKEPALALRYFNPDSPLSDQNGWIDLTVRLSSDDCQRVPNGR